MACRNGNVGAPTMAIDKVINMVEENKRVMGEGILREGAPPPVFCVSAGIIGLTGERRVSALRERRSGQAGMIEDSGE